MSKNVSKTPQKKYASLKGKKTAGNVITYIVLTILSIIWITPLVLIVLESFRCETTMQVGYIIPKEWGFKNYINLFQDLEKGFGKWYLNTMIIAVFVAVINTFMILCMSYTLSRTRFAGRKALMNGMLVLGMFPGFLSMVILYKVLYAAGLTLENAKWGLIIVYTASSAMGYYVCKGFFDTVPKSLDEAALVDGATRAQVLFKIILPMAKPVVIYTVLTAFMSPWADFMFASYVAHNAKAGMNVAVGLQNLIGSTASLAAHYTEFCAGGVLVAIPVTILFMCLQKYYVEGVTGGAVKG